MMKEYYSMHGGHLLGGPVDHLVVHRDPRDRSLGLSTLVPIYRKICEFLPLINIFIEKFIRSPMPLTMPQGPILLLATFTAASWNIAQLVSLLRVIKVSSGARIKP